LWYNGSSEVLWTKPLSAGVQIKNKIIEFNMDRFTSARQCFFFVTILAISISGCRDSLKKPYDNWEVYGGSKEAIHYSSLKEIDTMNVQRLQVAWVYHSGDADTLLHSQIQCNPIIIDGILYGVTPKIKVFALDAATGEQKWMFDPVKAISSDTSSSSRLLQKFSNISRGVTYWSDGKEDKRIFTTLLFMITIFFQA